MKWVIGYIGDLTDAQYDAVYAALSVSRKAHIDRMKHQDARKRSLLATHLLNTLLADCGKRGISVQTAENGRPYVDAMDVYVSISHSGDAVACVIDDRPIGIDVEYIRPVERNLMEYVCTARERTYVLESEDPTLRFFEVWTAKEACYKRGDHHEGLRAIETGSLTKQTFVIDGYYLTIV